MSANFDGALVGEVIGWWVVFFHGVSPYARSGLLSIVGLVVRRVGIRV